MAELLTHTFILDLTDPETVFNQTETARKNTEVILNFFQSKLEALPDCHPEKTNLLEVLQSRRSRLNTPVAQLMSYDQMMAVFQRKVSLEALVNRALFTLNVEDVRPIIREEFSRKLLEEGLARVESAQLVQQQVRGKPPLFQIDLPERVVDCVAQDAGVPGPYSAVLYAYAATFIGELSKVITGICRAHACSQPDTASAVS